jgi:gluconate 2-dehydrogenase gamma chain
MSMPAISPPPAAGLAGAIAIPIAIAQDQNGTPAPASPAAGGGDMAGMDMTAGAPTNTGFTFFVPYQARIVQAAAARIIPTDENGPGATEAGVVYFIDRQLAPAYGARGFRGPRYDAGPYLPAESTQGDQSALPLRDRFRLGIFGLDNYAKQRFQKGFADLAPEQQDQILTDLEQGIPADFGGTATHASPVNNVPNAQPAPGQAGISAKTFFNLLLSFTMAGFLADPVQGGNRDMVGWKLIGFPGAHFSWADQILNYGQPVQGDYISLGQYQEQVGGGA